MHTWALRGQADTTRTGTSGGFPSVCQLQLLSPEPISTGGVIQDACFGLSTPWKPSWPKYNSISMLRSGRPTSSCGSLLPSPFLAGRHHQHGGEGATMPPKSIASLCLAGHMTVKHFISLDLSFFFCNLKQFGYISDSQPCCT